MQRVSTVLLDLSNTLAGTKIRPVSDRIPAFEIAENAQSLLGRKEAPGTVLLGADPIDRATVDLCRELRRRYPETLLIVLSAAVPDEGYLVNVLEAGADECIPPPRSPREIQARLAAWTRRGTSTPTSPETDDAPMHVAIDAVNEAFYLLDHAWCFVFLNREAERLLNRRREDLVGRNVWEEFPAARETALYQRYHEALATGRADRFELYYAPLEILFEINVHPCPAGLAVTFYDITERRQTEKQLRDSERSYRLFFDNNPQPVLIYDLETLRFLAVNQAALKTYGYSREEFLNMTLEDIHPREELPSLRKNVEKVLSRDEDEIDHAGVWRHILKDGTTIYVEITSHPVEYNGRRGEIVLAYDVTRRHRVEQSLRDSQERFAAFMRNLPGIAFIKDREGRYVFANSGWEKLFELRFATAQGKTDHDLFSQAMADEFVANDRQVRRQTSPILTNEHIEKSGRTQHWLVAKFPMAEGEDPVANLGGVAIDITRETEAQQALEHRESELRKAHELLRFHVENSPLAVVEWDHEFRVIRWSKRAEELFGWTESEIDRCHPDEWRFVFPEDQEKVGRIMESLVNRREPRNVCVNRNFRKDGTVVHCEWYNSVRTDSEGGVASIFSLIHDITEEVKAKEEIVRFNTELEQRVAERTARLQAINEELESFSYSVSHDLRAPLRGIDGFARALEETAAEKLDGNARAYLQRIRNAAARMGQLIDDLLELSRISRMKLEKRPVDLSALAGEILDSFCEADPGRSVRTRIHPEILTEGDPRLLRIMLENLLNNAWKFSSQATPPEIEFGVDNTQNRSKVYYVRDNGVGFDMRYAHKLFGPFQRLHSISEFPGTGIGLATVKRVIQLHGGNVWARSSPDQGATFYFRL